MSHHHKGPQEERGPREATVPATRPTATSNSSDLATIGKLFSHERLVNELNLVVTELKDGYPELIDLIRVRVSKCRHQIEKSPEDKRTIYQDLDQLGDYLDEVVDYHRHIRDKIRDLKNHFLTVVKLDGESLAEILG